jgi:D-beta-D-heptose 7-phosphate kinase/D-beta-D-heptose 1-phosphate adenosyltransferase
MNSLVIGDVMLDRYLEGSVGRISPEAPVPVVALSHEWYRAGGAGNVAAALAGLGARTTIAGVVGADPEVARLRQALEEAGVAEAVLIERPGQRTICKTRVISHGHHQLLRLDQDGVRDEFVAGAGVLMQSLTELIGRHDVVVLSDYAKGTLTPELIRATVSACRERGIPCLIDPKLADFSVYAGATLLTPNLLEAQRAVRATLDGDEAVGAAAVRLREELKLDAMLITRGPDGMTLATAEQTTHFSAEVREVADVTGAGDTVVAVLAARLGLGDDLREACRVASIAAGIAVSHPGTYVVRAEELEAVRQGLSPKVVGWDEARSRVARARASGRRVVFTNGCFDILHAGHLSNLEQCRRLGDVLVVGLNSDASIRLNKGPGRPVVAERHRAALLAGLACVDLIVLFDEFTPENLIRHVEPDVLAKGGDYRLDQIAGAEFVQSRGGRVVTIPLVPGLSTTAILAASRDEG